MRMRMRMQFKALFDVSTNKYIRASPLAWCGRVLAFTCDAQQHTSPMTFPFVHYYHLLFMFPVHATLSSTVRCANESATAACSFATRCYGGTICLCSKQGDRAQPTPLRCSQPTIDQVHGKPYCVGCCANESTTTCVNARGSTISCGSLYHCSLDSSKSWA